ncbi:maintenance of mitochondrial structure and function-domain-containing protein [Hyaloraphidium curvatum]|nr:maintenance of mitochondrial structure and function-domain-containing protein [Hyaloraphidium curvatum]
MADSFLHLPLAGSLTASVSVNPTTFFAILDHYLRRPDGQARAVGALLGVRSEDGSEVEIRNSFAVPHKEPEGLIDKEYFDDMYTLQRRVNAKETPIGWYATGADIDDTVVRLHDLFAAETAPHPPILLLVDTSFSNDNLSIKAFVRTHLGVPPEERGSIFTQIPCDSKFFDAERTGLDIIAMAKDSAEGAGLLSDIENLERSVLRLMEMLDKVLDYVNRVVAGSEPVNNTIGRFLMDTVSSIPKMNGADFEKAFNGHLQDILMVVYLANLTRTQLSIAERLNGLEL